METDGGAGFLDWATLAIAAVALVQPWLVVLYRRYLRPGRIEIFETGRIEITYGPAGPSVALLGTLLGHDREMFVRTMAATVDRLRDGAQHQFEWAISRPFLISTGPTNTQYEMPAGFMLLPAAPQRYNVFLSDRLVAERMLEILNPLQEAWSRRLDERGMDVVTGTPGGTVPEDFRRLLQDTLRDAQYEFRDESEFESAVGDLDRLCYWDAGDYTVTLSVHTPDKSVSKVWRFSLTEGDERGLRGNAFKVVEDALSWENTSLLYAAISPYQPA